MGRVIRASSAIVFAVLVLFSASATTARGGVIFQTSSAPGTPTTSGVVIYGNQYLGVRFELSQPTTMNQIGLRMHRLDHPGSIFGAIVRLSSMSDYPDSIHPFNTPDVLATALLPTPATTADITADIGPLTAPAGIYALVFGSGEFGAAGDAGASQNNTPIGPQSYFYWNDGNGAYLDGSYGNVRMYVLNEVPEPSSAAAILAGVVGATGALSRRRRIDHAPRIACRKS